MMVLRVLVGLGWRTTVGAKFHADTGWSVLLLAQLYPWRSTTQLGRHHFKSTPGEDFELAAANSGEYIQETTA